MELAVEELNSQGGVLGRRIELIGADSREDTPTAALSAFRHLVEQEQVKLIVGPTWSAAAKALLPVASRRKRCRDDFSISRDARFQ